MRGRVLTIVLWVVALLASASKANAAMHAVWYRGESSCPSSQEVTAALRNILPDIVVAADSENALSVEIVEERQRFVVHAGNVERAYADVNDHCDERARKAAVFIALVLEPPTVDTPVEAVKETRPRLIDVALEAYGVFTLAPERTSPTWLAGGGAVDLFFGGHYVGGVVGIEGLSTVTRSFPDIVAHVTRLPVTAGVRARWQRRAVRLSLDVDAVLGPLFVRASSTKSPIDSTRLDAGVRLDGRVSWLVRRRVALFFALQADLLPKSYDLRLPTDLTVDKTPQYWLGLALGAAFDLR